MTMHSSDDGARGDMWHWCCSFACGAACLPACTGGCTGGLQSGCGGPAQHCGAPGGHSGQWGSHHQRPPRAPGHSRGQAGSGGGGQGEVAGLGDTELLRCTHSLIAGRTSGAHRPVRRCHVLASGSCGSTWTQRGLDPMVCHCGNWEGSCDIWPHLCIKKHLLRHRNRG